MRYPQRENKLCCPQGQRQVWAVTPHPERALVFLINFAELWGFQNKLQEGQGASEKVFGCNRF